MKLAQICFEVDGEGSSALNTDEKVVAQKTRMMEMMRT
jgi:hypothetical protein